MELREVVERMRSLANPESLEGMARFAIATDRAVGVRLPDLRRLAKEIGTDHGLAGALWETEVHEARILASMIDDPAEVTEAQLEGWVRDFDSWDVCDQCCSNLFDRTPFAWAKAAEWSGREGEFVKRAGFALMACLAVHDKEAEDAAFLRLLPLIEGEADDPRNFVKKAVNWALRQIGKRSLRLNGEAIREAKRILRRDTPAARWIARDALRELQGEKVQKRLRDRGA